MKTSEIERTWNQETRRDEIALPYEPFRVTAREAAEMRLQFSRVGVAVYGPPALDPWLVSALIEEAQEQRRVASWSLVGERKRGQIYQDNIRAHLGPICREFLAAGATGALLKAVTGYSLVPGWSATCLTYYDQPGKHMGLHTDKKDACFIGLLVYLSSSWPEERPPSPGLQLHIYKDDHGGELLARVTSRANRIIIFMGSELSHARPPLEEGETLMMLNGCYQKA